MIGAQTTPFPACCGATILHTFGDGYTDPKYLWDKYKFVSGHVYFAILAAAQQDRFGPMLEKAEFRLISDKTVNVNSKNRLYLWVRDPGVSSTPMGAVVKSFFER